MNLLKEHFFKHSPHPLTVLKNICFTFHPGINVVYWKLLRLLFLTLRI